MNKPTLTALVLLLACSSGLQAELTLPPSARRPALPAAQSQPTAPAAAEEPSEVPPAVPPGLGRIELLNGDRLTALLEGMDSREGLLVVRHPHIRDAVALETRSLGSFMAVAAAASKFSPWTVELTTGESLCGEVVEVNAEELVMDTAYAGRVKLSRGRIERMAQSSPVDYLIEDVGSDLDWNSTGARLEFTGRSIRMAGPATISRKHEGSMPAQFRLDLGLRAQQYNMVSAMLFADKPVAGGSLNAYGININMDVQVALMTHVAEQGGQSVATASFQRTGARTGEPSLYSFFFDLDKGTVLVFKDGQQMAEWKNVPRLKASGNFISLSSQSGMMWEVTELRLSLWDGKTLPGKEKAPVPGRSTGVTLRLQNGDTLSGDLAALRDGAAKMVTGFGSLDVPSERISAMFFNGIEAAPDVPEGSIRLTLQDRSRCMLSAAALSGGLFEGVSPGAGALRVPLGAVRSIEWKMGEKPGEAPAAEMSGRGAREIFMRGVNFGGAARAGVNVEVAPPPAKE